MQFLMITNFHINIIIKFVKYPYYEIIICFRENQWHIYFKIINCMHFRISYINEESYAYIIVKDKEIILGGFRFLASYQLVFAVFEALSVIVNREQ